MFGVISAILFGVAFLLYWWGEGGHVPFTPTGLTILGLLFLAVHLITGPWWPNWRRRPPQ